MVRLRDHKHLVHEKNIHSPRLRSHTKRRRKFRLDLKLESLLPWHVSKELKLELALAVELE